VVECRYGISVILLTSLVKSCVYSSLSDIECYTSYRWYDYAIIVVT